MNFFNKLYKFLCHNFLPEKITISVYFLFWKILIFLLRFSFAQIFRQFRKFLTFFNLKKIVIFVAKNKRSRMRKKNYPKIDLLFCLKIFSKENVVVKRKYWVEKWVEIFLFRY